MPAYPYAAVLFVMDGSVIDNVHLHQQVWRDFTLLHGLNLTDAELDFAKGRKALEIVTHFFGSGRSHEEIVRLTGERQDLYRERLASSDQIRPVAGVEDYLAGLGMLGVRRILATDAPQANVAAVFRKFPLSSLFDAVVTSDDVRHGKPEPDVFLAAAARAGADPASCLAAEDSAAGIAAAKAAGCVCLGMITTQTEAELRAQGVEFVAADFRNLPPRIALPPSMTVASETALGIS